LRKETPSFMSGSDFAVNGYKFTWKGENVNIFLIY
jgi:hypothetical protein